MVRKLGDHMLISVTDAKQRLTELVRRAKAGDDIIVTRRGRIVARLVPIRPAPTARAKRMLLEAVRSSGSARATVGPDAARSQDFLYGEEGVPL